MFTIYPWLIWVTPLAGALLTPIFAKIHPTVRNYAAVAFTLSTAVFATFTALMVPAGDYTLPWIPSFQLPSGKGTPVTAGVLVDPLSMFMINIVAWISFLIMVYSLGYMKGDNGLTRYWFFMNLFIGNMLLLVLADNLLMMFFGWEGVGLCSYALIGHYYRDQQEYWVGTPGDKALGIEQAYPPSHAGMKAFVVTRIGDIALMIAIFLIYAFAGTFNYTDLAAQLAASGGGWAAGLARLGLLVPTAILFFGGPIGKSAQFPLQEWLPDAMAGPTSVSALIHAATMVKAGVFLTGRMGPIFYAALAAYGALIPFFGTIAWIGAITAFLAAIQATVQREIKKVLAYSTVSQIGYMMLGLGLAGLGTRFLLDGYTGGLFHVMSHAVFKASMFLAAGWVLHVAESRFMDEMGGLRKALRFTWISMFIAGLSLMGIPPLSGFWTKDQVLFTSFAAGQYLLYIVALATVLLTGFYTMRMLGMTFTGKPSVHMEKMEEHGHHAHEASLVMLIPYFALAMASVAIGVIFLFIRDPLTDYLAQTTSLPTVSRVETGASPIPGLSLEVLLTLVSVVTALAGAAVGYLRYFGKTRPFNMDGMNPIQHFLFERLYINAVYYKVFVNGMIAAGRGLYHYVELNVWDRLNQLVPRDIYEYSERSALVDSRLVDGAVAGIATSGSRFSNLLRRMQTGVTEQYVLGFAIGIFLLLLYMIFFIGAS